MNFSKKAMAFTALLFHMSFSNVISGQINLRLCWADGIPFVHGDSTDFMDSVFRTSTSDSGLKFIHNGGMDDCPGGHELQLKALNGGRIMDSAINFFALDTFQMLDSLRQTFLNIYHVELQGPNCRAQAKPYDDSRTILYVSNNKLFVKFQVIYFDSAIDLNPRFVKLAYAFQTDGTGKVSTEKKNFENKSLLFSVFPNPIVCKLSITFDHNRKFANILLSNIVGQSIKRFKKTNISGLSLDFSGLSKGIYLLQIQTEDLKISRKLLRL